jgi:hypothetical protein
MHGPDGKDYASARVFLGARVAAFVRPANEQNLARLAAEVLTPP